MSQRTPVEERKMAIRNNAPRESFDDSTPVAEVWNADGTPKMLVKIDGLKQVGPDEFELSGVLQRPIHWVGIAAALGFESGQVPDKLADDIAAVVWDYDIREILAQRIHRR